MSLTNVKEYLKKFGIEERILILDESSATVELAAKALNTEPKRIAKTLSFIQKELPILIVAAGDAKVDNKKYKEEFSIKAKMIGYEEAESLVGHQPGGICPFGVKDGVLIYLDESLKRFETVFPAAGSSNSAIEMSIEELEKYISFVKWVDVCKDWEE